MKDSQTPREFIDDLAEDKDLPQSVKNKAMRLRQKRFVEEYLIDLNEVRAYRAAGYRAKKENTRQAAWTLLQNKRIRRAISQAMEERSRRTHITQDRVLKELARIGFSDVADVSTWNECGLNVKDSSTLDKDITAAISEVSVKFTEYGADVKVRMYPKHEALRSIGEHLGMWSKEKDKGRDAVTEAQEIWKMVNEMQATMVSTAGSLATAMIHEIERIDDKRKSKTTKS